MSDRLAILFNLHREAMDHCRHLETQRSQFASVLLGVTAAVMTFGIPISGVRSAYHPGALITGVGVFGLILSWKQNEKINYHRIIAIRLRGLIENLPDVTGDKLDEMRRNEEKENDQRYRRIAILPTGLFWSGLYLMITAVGLFIVLGG